MIWIKPVRGSYHLMRGGYALMCGVRIDLDGNQEIDISFDPPGDERCKNCMRSIDQIHHLAHIHKNRVIGDVVYRYGKHPMIFTRRLIICNDFGKIEKLFKNVWIQQSGYANGMPLRSAIAVYPIHEKGHIDTDNPKIIMIKYGKYYKFE